MIEPTAEPTPPRRKVLNKKTAIDFLQTTGEALLLFLVISLLTGRFEIHQVSMEPNLHEGQRVIVSKLEKLWPSWLLGRAEAASQPSTSPVSLQHGQIVVLYKSASHTEDPLIKRVIGLPGDTVEVYDGGVYLNGIKLDEPYLFGRRTTCNSYCAPVTLGSDQYFVMGDNRPNSLDSRTFGPIPADQIVGRVIVRYWPLDQLAFYP
ncbi:MAG: signal peptidase I [Chloroflexota bacterium]